MVTYEVTTLVESGLVEAYERHLAKHAPRLREEFASQFPAGVTASREVWLALQSWSASASRVMIAPEQLVRE